MKSSFVFALLFVLLLAIAAPSAEARRYKCVRYKRDCEYRARGRCCYSRRRRCRRSRRGRRRRCRSYCRKRGYKCRSRRRFIDDGPDVDPVDDSPLPPTQNFCPETCVPSWRLARSGCNRSACFIRRCGARGYYTCTRGTVAERPPLPVTARICGGGCGPKGVCDPTYCEYRRCSATGYSCVRKLFVDPKPDTGIKPIVCPAVCRLQFLTAQSTCNSLACKVILCQFAKRVPVVEGFGCVSRVDPAFLNVAEVTAAPPVVTTTTTTTTTTTSTTTSTTSTTSTTTTTTSTTSTSTTTTSSTTSTTTTTTTTTLDKSANAFVAAIQVNGTAVDQTSTIRAGNVQFRATVDTVVNRVVNPSNVRSEITSIVCTPGTTTASVRIVNTGSLTGITVTHLYKTGWTLSIDTRIWPCLLRMFPSTAPAGETAEQRALRLLRSRTQRLTFAYLRITGATGTANDATITGTPVTSLASFTGSITLVRATTGRMLVQDPMVERMIEETEGIGPQLQSDALDLLPMTRQGAVSNAFVTSGAASVTITGNAEKTGGLESSNIVVAGSAVSGTTVYLCDATTSLTTAASNVGATDLNIVTNILLLGAVIEVNIGADVLPVLYLDYLLVDGLAVLDSKSSGTLSFSSATDGFTFRKSRYTFTLGGSAVAPSTSSSVTFISGSVSVTPATPAFPTPTPLLGTNVTVHGDVGSIAGKYVYFPGTAVALEALSLTNVVAKTEDTLSAVTGGLGPDCGVSHQTQVTLTRSIATQVVISTGSVTASDLGVTINNAASTFCFTTAPPVTVTPMP